jgi:hypothetical protein
VDTKDTRVIKQYSPQLTAVSAAPFMAIQAAQCVKLNIFEVREHRHANSHHDRKRFFPGVF